MLPHRWRVHSFLCRIKPSMKWDYARYNVILIGYLKTGWLCLAWLRIFIWCTCLCVFLIFMVWCCPMVKSKGVASACSELLILPISDSIELRHLIIWFADGLYPFYRLVNSSKKNTLRCIDSWEHLIFAVSNCSIVMGFFFLSCYR